MIYLKYGFLFWINMTLGQQVEPYQSSNWNLTWNWRKESYETWNSLETISSWQAIWFWHLKQLYTLHPIKSAIDELAWLVLPLYLLQCFYTKTRNTKNLRGQNINKESCRGQSSLARIWKWICFVSKGIEAVTGWSRKDAFNHWEMQGLDIHYINGSNKSGWLGQDYKEKE